MSARPALCVCGDDVDCERAVCSRQHPCCSTASHIQATHCHPDCYCCVHSEMYVFVCRVCAFSLCETMHVAKQQQHECALTLPINPRSFRIQQAQCTCACMLTSPATLALAVNVFLETLMSTRPVHTLQHECTNTLLTVFNTHSRSVVTR
jgi:hypothetical protein